MLCFGVCGVSSEASSKQFILPHRRGLDKQYAWLGKTQLLLALVLTNCVSEACYFASLLISLLRREGRMARGLFCYLEAIDLSFPQVFAFSSTQARWGRLWGYEMLKR